MRRTTPRLREPSPCTVRASRTTGRFDASLRRFALGCVASLFLTFSGAFGTGTAPFAARLAFWAATMTAGSLVGEAMGAVLDRKGWLDRTPWRCGLALTAIISIPVCAVALLATAVLAKRTPDVARLVQFAPTTLAVSAAMVALNLTVGRRPAFTHAADERETQRDPPTARFLARLPARLRGGDLHAVEAEDHYLRLHTSRGSDLILMRLTDAIDELDGLEGAQTHRSWWVARAAVTEARRRGARTSLILRGGVEAPVSRTYARALRDAGWFTAATPRSLADSGAGA